MRALHIQNLEMIITEKCNLNCSHCTRGKCSNKVISNEVIEATLSQVISVKNLIISGGEPTLALDRLEKIFSYIISKNILVDKVTITINGTIYSENFLKLLKSIYNYMNHDQMFLKSSPYFMISNDEYHLKEIERLNLMKQYLENIKQYQESEYFYGLKNIKEKIFCEGYAENLDKDLTIPLKPVKNIMTYIDSKKKLNIRKGLCNIGPFVTVNVNGNITECNASFEHQNTIYNYGNVLTDSIESVYLKQKIKIIKPKKWELETAKIMEKF